MGIRRHGSIDPHNLTCKALISWIVQRFGQPEVNPLSGSTLCNGLVAEKKTPILQSSPIFYQIDYKKDLNLKFERIWTNCRHQQHFKRHIHTFKINKIAMALLFASTISWGMASKHKSVRSNRKFKHKNDRYIHPHDLSSEIPVI